MRLAASSALPCDGESVLAQYDLLLTDMCCAAQAIELKQCDVYSYKTDFETDPFGEPCSCSWHTPARMC